MGSVNRIDLSDRFVLFVGGCESFHKATLDMISWLINYAWLWFSQFAMRSSSITTALSYIRHIIRVNIKSPGFATKSVLKWKWSQRVVINRQCLSCFDHFCILPWGAHAWLECSIWYLVPSVSSGAYQYFTSNSTTKWIIYSSTEWIHPNTLILYIWFAWILLS